MKKILFVIILTYAIAGIVRAQDVRRYCFTTEKRLEAIQKNPDVLIKEQELEIFTENYIQHANASRMANPPVYIIPLVFHIIHNYGQENISDETLLDAVRILNLDYRKLNPDTVNTIPVFKPLAGDAEIEFRLANIDPDGNCTNGIDRVVSLLTYSADDNAKLNDWDHTKYLNIWVVHDLANAGAAAYAYLPGTGSASVDGIIARYDYVGSIGAGSPTTSRVLTHEIGHYLNLLHPWGATNSPGVSCSGDDYVSDTPQTMGWTYCNLNGSVCNPPIIENVQNYMDYSYCDNMFTIGQTVRMRAALNSPTSGRNNLWSSANLIATGTDGSPQVCIPHADFNSDTKYTCAGSTINFKDASWNARPTSWHWTFSNGVPPTSTDSAPSVMFPNPGLDTVKLVVSNSAGADSITGFDYIRISGPAVASIPFSESFENANSFPGTDGFVINPDNGLTWTRATNAASAGTASIRINNYLNVDGAIDTWVSPSMDFSNISFPITLSFKYANAQRSSTSADELKVYGSYTCGKSWIGIFSAAGASLSTAGIVSTSFTPSNASQWRQQSQIVNQYQHKPNVRFKFENISNMGNNTYVDEINLTGLITNVDEVDELELGYSLYPNPTTGNTNIQFSLATKQKVTLDVKDITGRVVNEVIHEELNAGLHDYNITVNSPGIFLVDMTVNGKHHVRKLVISGN